MSQKSSINEEIGWYCKGYASGKSEKMVFDFPPRNDEDAIFDWLDGLACVHADYPDHEAMLGILENDFTRGESFNAFLLRIAGKEIYKFLTITGTLKQWESK